MPRRDTEPPHRRCADRDRHTPRPEGFLRYMAWAEAMGRTHDQERCPTCGLWVIWTEREER